MTPQEGDIGFSFQTLVSGRRLGRPSVRRLGRGESRPAIWGAVPGL